MAGRLSNMLPVVMERAGITEAEAAALQAYRHDMPERSALLPPGRAEEIVRIIAREPQCGEARAVEIVGGMLVLYPHDPIHKASQDVAQGFCGAAVKVVACLPACVARCVPGAVLRGNPKFVPAIADLIRIVGGLEGEWRALGMSARAMMDESARRAEEVGRKARLEAGREASRLAGGPLREMAETYRREGRELPQVLAMVLAPDDERRGAHGARREQDGEGGRGEAAGVRAGAGADDAGTPEGG